MKTLRDTKAQIILVILIVVVFYIPNTNSYFQQDEWLAFGNSFPRLNDSLQSALAIYLAPNIGHFVPFHHALFDVQLKLFGLDFQKWFIASLIWHLSTTFLVYKLSNKLTNSKLSIFISLLFGVLYSASQATTWVGSDINTHGATFFSLLALYAFLSAKKHKYALTLLLLAISLLFKESSLGMVPVILLVPFLFDYKKPLFKKNLAFLGVFLGVYVFLRLLMFINPEASASASVFTSYQTPQFLLINLFTFPGKALFQTLVPTPIFHNIFLLSKNILGNLKISAPDILIESSLMELFSFTFIFTAIAITFKAFRSGGLAKSKVLIFGLTFIIFNSIIFAFSPEKRGIVSFHESRNLYLISFGVVVWLYGAVSQYINSKKVALVIFIFISLVNVFFLFSDALKNAELGQIRKQILECISYRLDMRNSNVVLVTLSDSPYYGLEEKIMPFQSGFGHTFLVYNHLTKNLSEMDNSGILWPIKSQGVVRNNNRSFAYYRDLKTYDLNSREMNLNINDTYFFTWSDKERLLLDLTDEYRKKFDSTK